MTERIASSRRFLFYKGRVALYALLKALNVGVFDEVIVPVYTCPECLEPIERTGARLVYCDIDRKTFCVPPEAVERALTRKTKAIIIQHTFGIPSPLLESIPVCRSKGIAVLEDCCHVSESAYRGAPLGSFGDASFFSHAWGKPLAVGGGGVASVNADWLAEAVVRNYAGFALPGLREEAQMTLENVCFRAAKSVCACLPGLCNRLRGAGGAESPNGAEAVTKSGLSPEYAKRMPRATAYFLEQMLHEYHGRVSLRKRAIARYEDGFQSVGLDCFKYPDGCEITLWRYPLLAIAKSTLLREAREHSVRMYDWGTTPLRALAKDPIGDGRAPLDFPVARDVAEHIVTLPIAESSRTTEIDRTIEFLGRAKSRGLL